MSEVCKLVFINRSRQAASQMPTMQAGPDRRALCTARFSDNGRCPDTAAIPFVADPCSASRRRAALRNQWAARCGDRPGPLWVASIKALRPLTCRLGLEGIVSKRRNSPYRSGRSTDWIKSKNPAVPAVKREAEEHWGAWSAKAKTFQPVTITPPLADRGRSGRSGHATAAHPASDSRR